MHRLLWRVPLVFTAILVCQTALIVISPLRRRAPRFWRHWRNLLLRGWGRLLVHTLGIEVEVSGTPPRGAFLLVSNHVSYVDIPLLSALVDVAFVAKADIDSWPLLGAAVSTGDTIFVDRTRRRDLVSVIEKMEERWAIPLGIVVFPEGTSSPGEEVLPFRPSLLEVAATRDEPVRWAAIHYRTPPGAPPARDAVCWHGDALLVPHLLALLRLPRFTARVHFGETAIHGDDRKRLARDLQRATADALAAMIGETDRSKG